MEESPEIIDAFISVFGFKPHKPPGEIYRTFEAGYKMGVRNIPTPPAAHEGE